MLYMYSKEYPIFSSIKTKYKGRSKYKNKKDLQYSKPQILQLGSHRSRRAIQGMEQGV